MTLFAFFAMNRVLLFSFLTGLFMPSLGNIGHQGSYVIAMLLAFYGIAKTRRMPVSPLPPLTMLAALLWCWLSVSWAIDPGSSIRKLSLTTCIIITAFATVSLVSYERCVAILRRQALIALILCYLMVVLLPSAGIQGRLGTLDEVGGWRGIMVDKNSCGGFCAVAVLLFLFDGAKLKPLFRWGMVIAAIVFLIGTRSKTAAGILVAVVPFGFLVTRYNSAFRLLLVPVALCGVAFVALAWGRMLLPFERALYDPEAFTGRGLIWATLVGYIRDHWLLGAGYGSFWDIGPRSPVFVYTDVKWVQAIFVGHNGYLDVWSQLGLPGLILVVLAVFVVPIGRILKSRRLPSSRSALLMTLLLFVMGDNLTESTVFDRDMLLNIIVMIVVALIATGEQDGREADAARTEPVRRPGALRSRHRVNRAGIGQVVDQAAG